MKEKRNIKLTVRLTERERDLLKQYAKKASMSEAHLIRCLISGYHPPESPDEKFFEQMNELIVSCAHLASVAKVRKGDDKRGIAEEILAIKDLRRSIMKKYLMGERRDILGSN